MKEIQADRGELPADRSILTTTILGELVRRYRDEILPRKRGEDVERTIIYAFLRHPINRKPLSAITAADFASYRDERRSAITPKSLKRQLSPLSNMFEVSMREWKLPC